MNDKVVPLPQVAQQLHMSGDAARRRVLRAGPEASEVRSGRRYVSLSWLEETIAEHEKASAAQ